jgi:hypothetical protein
MYAYQNGTHMHPASGWGRLEAEDPHMAGRPTDCTPELTATVADAVRRGCTYRLACQAAGISPQTLATWKQRGEEGEQPFAEFLDALTRAEGEHAARLASVLHGFADGTDDCDPRVRTDAAKFMLERRHPHDYGRTVQEVEHSGQVVTVAVEGVEGLPAELLARVGKPVA